MDRTHPRGRSRSGTTPVKMSAELRVFTNALERETRGTSGVKIVDDSLTRYRQRARGNRAPLQSLLVDFA